MHCVSDGDACDDDDYDGVLDDDDACPLVADDGPDGCEAEGDVGADTGADAGPDSGTDVGTDFGSPDSGADVGGADTGGGSTPDTGGCSCSSNPAGGAPAAGIILFGLLAVRRRRL